MSDATDGTTPPSHSHPHPHPHPQHPPPFTVQTQPTPSGREPELDSSDVYDLTALHPSSLDHSARDSETASSVAHSYFSDGENERHVVCEPSSSSRPAANRRYGRNTVIGLMSSDNSVGSSVVQDVGDDIDDDDDGDGNGMGDDMDDGRAFLPAAVPIDGIATTAGRATVETRGVSSEDESKEIRRRNEERIRSLRGILGAGIEYDVEPREARRRGGDGGGSSSSSSSSSSENHNRTKSSRRKEDAKITKPSETADDDDDVNAPTKSSDHVANPRRRNSYAPQPSMDLDDLGLDLDTTALEQYDGVSVNEEGEEDGEGSLVSLVTVDTREELERLKALNEAGGIEGRGSKEEEEYAAAEYLLEDENDDYRDGANDTDYAIHGAMPLVEAAKEKNEYNVPHGTNQGNQRGNENRRKEEEHHPSSQTSSPNISPTSSADQKLKQLRVSFTDESGTGSLTEEIPDKRRGMHRWRMKQPTFSKQSYRNKNSASSRFPALQFRKSRSAKAATIEEQGSSGGGGGSGGGTAKSQEESAGSGWKSADPERGDTIGGADMGGGVGTRFVASSNKPTENPRNIDDGEMSIFSGGTSLYSGGSGSTIISANTEYGRLLKDTYSFIYIYKGCPMSYPFAYAMMIFLFQAAIYILLLSSLVDFGSPYNPLKVPAVASLELRIAQVLALIIAVASAVDIMVAMNNLLRPPDAIVVLDTPMDSHRYSPRHIPDGDGSTTTASGSTASGPPTIAVGFRFKLGNALRLLEGCFAVATTFILIVQAPNVIELFINFAALDFIVNIDTLAFALAEHGMVNDKIQFAAKYIDGLGLDYLDNPSTSLRSRRRRNACASSASVDRAGRLARIKSNFIFRLFKSPANVLRSRPDATRRFTLLTMFLIMFSSWSIITFEQNGQFDYLCKSIRIEFYHDRLLDVDGGANPFLNSRSGTYTAIFEHKKSYLEWLSDIATQQKRVLAYKKANDHIQPPVFGTSIVEAFAPPKFLDLVLYDPNLQKWIFVTCDSTIDWRLNRRSACVGPEVHSVETPNLDITALASSAFVLADGKEEETSVILQASISCNECSPRSPGDYQVVGPGNSMVCEMSGGHCSSPNPVFGWSRTCSCPSGQYGMFCDKLLKATCPLLEFETVEVPVTSDGTAMPFRRFELKPFRLQSHAHGVDNSPIWERIRDGIEGQYDRVERRGGTYWTITRFNPDSSMRTIAMAIDEEATEGVAPVTGVSKLMELQPQPAGLKWYFPKVTKWGPVPDLNRPYDLKMLRCRAYGNREGEE